MNLPGNSIALFGGHLAVWMFAVSEVENVIASPIILQAAVEGRPQ